MGKHLTLSDRAIIERYLVHDMTFSYIARRLERSPSTISREVKNHRCFVYGFRYSDNPCINYRSCIRRNLCVRTVQNLTVISYVLNSFLLIVTRWTNLLMFVLGVLTKRNVKRTMRITPHTELMQSTQNSFIMPVPVFVPILSA